MTTATPTKTVLPTGTWDLDSHHSKLGFAVKHMGVSTVRGEFGEFEGVLEIGETPEESRIYGTAKTASVNTGQPDRDEHLRSPDFFDAESNPELRFESKRIETVDDETLRVIADLTINGVTREIELEAEVGGTTVGMQDEERLGLEATGKLSRKDFGMKFNAALGGGNAVVADKVKLALDVSAVKRS
jgi:polyisoprenoid-binding protein YceI